jgi:hypothetical protein
MGTHSDWNAKRLRFEKSENKPKWLAGCYV